MCYVNLAYLYKLRVKKKKPRIDFFQHIFLDVGDGQNIMLGESTFVSKLNSYSQTIHHVKNISDSQKGKIMNTKNKELAPLMDKNLSLCVQIHLNY